MSYCLSIATRKVFNIEQTAELRFTYIQRMTRKVALLWAHAAHRGLYARIAKQLGLDPSYISRVANGKRRSKRISLAIEVELGRIYTSSGKIAQRSGKTSIIFRSKKSPRVAD